MPSATPDAISDAALARHRLAGLREQRRALRLGMDEIIERTREAVNQAIGLGVPIAEIARLLEMDRSSVYRTYVETPAGR